MESSRSLRQFSLVSKLCKERSDPLLYRARSLPNGHADLATTKRIVCRLLDPEDHLLSYVRSLKISWLREEQGMLDANDVERILGNLSQLMSFRYRIHSSKYFCLLEVTRSMAKEDWLTIHSWDTKDDIPERVISRLEQQWPSVKLMANRHDRADDDSRLLSSPLLHSLTYSILNYTVTVTGTQQLTQYSKLPKLREVLFKNPSLKKLEIKFHYHRTGKGIDWENSTATPHLRTYSRCPNRPFRTVLRIQSHILRVIYSRDRSQNSTLNPDWDYTDTGSLCSSITTSAG